MTHDKRIFFMVWNSETGKTNQQHTTKAEAQREVERLAGIYPSQTFFVLKAISASIKKQVTTEELTE